MLQLPPDVLAELPARLDDPTAWSSALHFALPRLCPVWLGRQITGKKKVERGGWMRGFPKGAADLGGWARGGLAVQVEAKLGAGRLEPEQKVWREVCRAWGPVHLVAHANHTDPTDEQIYRVAAELNAMLRARGVEA